MSYILDALKKSEKERRNKTAPDILSVQEAVENPSHRRSLWPYLLLAALFLNAGILAWWLAYSHPKKLPPLVESRAAKYENQPVSREHNKAPMSGITSETNENAIAKKPIIQEEKTNQKAEIAAARSIGARNDMGKLSSSENTPVRTPAGSEKVPAVLNPVLKQSQPAQPARSEIQNPTVSTGVQAANQPASEPKTGLPKANTVSVPPSVPPPARIEPAPVENKTYSLAELPESIKQDLPSFSISAHIHSSEPSSRMVKINGATMKEGQELLTGLKISEITPNGVIMIYRGYRFNVGLIR